MKTIGIIGGLAWPSTVEYYRLLCMKTNEHFRMKGAAPPYPTPHMIIESLNIADTRELRGKDGDESSWQHYDDVFRATFLRLKKAGADFGLIASNTPHMRLKGITRGLGFPIVSILDSTAAAVQTLGGARALVLGTPVTMKSPVYPQTLERSGIDVISGMTDEEIAEIGHLIDVDLYQGEIGTARERIAGLCEKYVSTPASDIVCLACTELPLAFPDHQNSTDFNYGGISYVNTTVAHIDATLREALN